tara:strand:- start:44 stop:169 length:126 start_codon:yes stop_codon:yes gene_type:complete
MEIFNSIMQVFGNIIGVVIIYLLATKVKIEICVEEEGKSND